MQPTKKEINEALEWIALCMRFGGIGYWEEGIGYTPGEKRQRQLNTIKHGLEALWGLVSDEK